MHHPLITLPKTSATVRRFLVPLVLGLAGYGVACSSGDGGGGSAATGGSGGAAGSLQGGASGVAGSGGSQQGGGGLGGAAGKAGSVTDPCAGKTCDDGIACTTDTCQAGECVHKVDATACPSGQYCTIEKGCVAAPACANNEQCKEMWKSEPCKANPRCDAASAVCVFDPLDKDNDKHEPIVCGGDDCDDSDGQRYPTAPELCDGKDNNCDGTVDEQAKCYVNGVSVEDPMRVCKASKCECKPEFTCGTTCTDKQTDAKNCGECGKDCGVKGLCQAGKCSCALGALLCNGQCADVQNDMNNCGTCSNVCEYSPQPDIPPFPQPCMEGVCRCGDDPAKLLCKSNSSDPEVPKFFCADPSDPAHCGSCDNACPAGVDCVGGKCNCPAEKPIICPIFPGAADKGCTNTDTDKKNCGGCEKACADTEKCEGGKCVCKLVCGGACVPSDAKNCGECGKVCAPGEFCQSLNLGDFCQGSGGQGCPSCGGPCVNFATDPQNCGSCGVACDTPNGEVCKDSKCVKP